MKRRSAIEASKWDILGDCQCLNVMLEKITNGAMDV